MEWLQQRNGAGRAVFVIFLAAACSFPGLARAASIHWYRNMKKASEQARQANKPMLIDFWASWCGPCKVMENNVYTDRDVVRATGSLITVRINFDRKAALARSYNVSGLPTLLFTDSYGTELFRYSGYIGAKGLAALLRSLPANVTEFNRLHQILAKDKNNFEALQAMGKALRAAGLFRTSNTYYRKALRRHAAKANPRTRQSILTEMAMNSLDVRDARQAADTFAKCIQEFPASSEKRQWILGLAQAYALGGKKAQAAKSLNRLIRKYPGTIESQKAKELLRSL